MKYNNNPNNKLTTSRLHQQKLVAETSERISYDDNLCLERKITKAEQKDINPDVALKKVE